MRSTLTIVILITSAGCSQSSGVPEIDRVRDRVAAQVDVDPSLRRVADAADGAARTASRARTVEDAAAAVGSGTMAVACAGVQVRKPIADKAGAMFARDVPEGEGKRLLAEGYAQADQAAQALPNPCPN